MLQKVLGPLFGVMPFLFGLGFVGPVIAESLAALAPPLSVSPYLIGLPIGAAWGAFANWSGRWI